MTELTTKRTVQSTDKKSERMRKARINAGLSQREAAEKIGV